MLKFNLSGTLLWNLSSRVIFFKKIFPNKQVISFSLELTIVYFLPLQENSADALKFSIQIYTIFTFIRW